MKGSDDILMTYLRVSQHMSRLFRVHFGRLQLTFPQALVLTVLGEEGPMPISTLAERTGSANSTVSGIVDRLEKLELARRDRSGEDRRVIYVAVTGRCGKRRRPTWAATSAPSCAPCRRRTDSSSPPPCTSWMRLFCPRRRRTLGCKFVFHVIFPSLSDILTL